MIGSELTKEERTCLHRNVRMAFPHLQTETVKNEQEVNYPAYHVGHLKKMGEGCYRGAKVLINLEQNSIKV